MILRALAFLAATLFFIGLARSQPAQTTPPPPATLTLDQAERMLGQMLIANNACATKVSELTNDVARLSAALAKLHPPPDAPQPPKLPK